MTTPTTTLTLALGLAIAGCGSDPTGSGETDVPVVEPTCLGACDDGDPCTDDRCLDTGACEHLPRDVANACRNDLHCDDGVACTDDHCVVDECGLERCQHLDPNGVCEPCFDWSQCDDGDSCSDEHCVGGFCTHSPEPHCDPLCEPKPAPFPMAAAEVEWRRPADCDACPCDSPPLYQGVDRLETFPLIVAGGHCRIVCGDGESGLAVDCAPLVYGVDYRVLGAPSEAGLVVERWCTQDLLARDPQPLHGTLTVDGLAPVSVRLVPMSAGYELRCDQASCAPLLGETLAVERPGGRESQAKTLKLTLDGTTMLAVLVPTSDGVAGIVRELGPSDDPREGELVLHLDTDPRPVDAVSP